MYIDVECVVVCVPGGEGRDVGGLQTRTHLEID
jgi:hypothetical protein